jgi:FRG domain
MAKLLQPSPGHIESVHDLQKAFDSFLEGDSGQGHLRGHSDGSWKLIPTIARRHRYWSDTDEFFSPQQEWQLLQRFRRFAWPQAGRILTPWEAIFLARHHGLPVRLLDWTFNPLVALFNAVEPHDYGDRDGAVWLLRRKLSEPSDIDVLKDEDPLEIPGVRFVHPTHVSPRLVVQGGSFTIHSHPWTDLADLDSNQPKVDVLRLQKLVVPAAAKKKLVNELLRLGVSTRTLFPDLDGIARGLWQIEAMHPNR